MISVWSLSGLHNFRLTKIDVLEEGKVKRSTNGVVLVLGEDNVTTIVAALNGAHDVLGVILAVAVGLDGAGPLARRRSGKRLSRVVGRNWVVRSLGRSDLCVAFLDGRSKRRGCERKCENFRDTHVCDCTMMSG